jgi:hypothetical protein
VDVPEKEFLVDISLTKYLILLAHAILQSPSTGGFLQKTILYSGLKIHTKKIRETRKLESIKKIHE